MDDLDLEKLSTVPHGERYGKLIDIVDEIDALNEKSVSVGHIDVPALKILLKEYLTLSGHVAFTEPEVIWRIQRVLGRAIIAYSYRKSSIYRGKIHPEWLLHDNCLDRTIDEFFVTKNDLRDMDSWLTGDFDAFYNHTSGTTGLPFTYRIWTNAYKFIELERHYKMILEEFGLTKPNVLYLNTALPGTVYHQHKYGNCTLEVASGDDITNKFSIIHATHGGEGTPHAMILDQNAFLHMTDFCGFVVEYVKKHNIKVLLSTGSFFEILVTHLLGESDAGFPKLFDLVSNTGDRANTETLSFLKEMEVTKNWCNHMRCWDGGASFFTCKHNVFHLQDELSYVYTTDDGKLASVDFFSYPSPFVNYVNGDHAKIGKEYKQCACGRWYRDFEFHDRKMRNITNSQGDFIDTDTAMKSILGKYHLHFVNFQEGSVSIEDTGLDEATKKSIIEDMSKLYVMVHFFSNAALGASDVSSLSTEGCNCVSPFFCSMQCNTFDNTQCCAWGFVSKTLNDYFCCQFLPF